MALELSGRTLRETERDRELFVDRESELEAVRKALLNGANALVLGRKGSGKSSFLRYVAHELRETGRPVGVVDGRAAASASEFLVLLRDELRAWNRISLSEAAAVLSASVSALAHDPRLVLRHPPQMETQTLLAEIAELRAGLAEGESFVLVDEMPSPQAAQLLFGRLRDELWELPLVWLVAADERDRALYLEPPADAFWRRIVALSPLDLDASIELLRRRIRDREVAQDVLESIAREARGSPRQLIALAYDVLVEGRDPDDASARREERRRREQGLTDPARRLLAELDADGAASPSDEGLLTKLGWTRSRASQVFRELEKQGFVRATERRGTGTRPRRIYEVIA